jgi:hypothetical protein
MGNTGEILFLGRSLYQEKANLLSIKQASVIKDTI